MGGKRSIFTPGGLENRHHFRDSLIPLTRVQLRLPVSGPVTSQFVVSVVMTTGYKNAHYAHHAQHSHSIIHYIHYTVTAQTLYDTIQYYKLRANHKHSSCETHPGGEETCFALEEVFSTLPNLAKKLADWRSMTSDLAAPS